MFWNILERLDEKIDKESNLLNGNDASEGNQTLKAARSAPFERLIYHLKGIFGSNKFDITHGAMASMTAEAGLTTFRNALDFLSDYFKCTGHGDLLKEIKLKCLTSRMVECFFFFLHVLGNNVILLEMARRITNDGFCYLLPFVDNKGSGVTSRNEQK